MAMFLAVTSLVLVVLGFAFVCAAALGVMRFREPLQRMHAATKAGTVGAGLTVAGAALGSGDGLTMMIGALTVLFLIFTVPVAGHLLGRAIYMTDHSLDSFEKAARTKD